MLRPSTSTSHVNKLAFTTNSCPLKDFAKDKNSIPNVIAMDL